MKLRGAWLSVSEQDNRTSVVFTGDNMFAPGSADVNDVIKPTLDKVAFRN